MTWRNYREESRRDWGSDLGDGQAVSMDGLRLGALLRIADSLEKIAQNYSELIRERDMYKGWSENRSNRIDALRRSQASLRGVITRIKKAKP